MARFSRGPGAVRAGFRQGSGGDGFFAGRQQLGHQGLHAADVLAEGQGTDAAEEQALLDVAAAAGQDSDLIRRRLERDLLPPAEGAR